ncbi:MutT/nudix family protein [Aspergillus lucknowensis]|uniref:NUDIX hydrolase domain-like protein n=1 Tax=Aspergillus lucknowensis TaxID=176173 RepID=A0ABR4LVI6_9EURO
MPGPKYTGSKFLSKGPLDPREAKWAKLVKTNYRDPNGIERTWESAERLPTGPELLLQKQYRPPIDKVVIEVPAGLIDPNETVEECAVRELREETGYVGVAEETSTVMYNDPGFCNTNLNMVHVSVDMTLPENQDPKPQLEDNEFIECFTVPLAALLDEMKNLEAEGYAIDARIGTIAEGIELAKKWKL